MKDKFAFCDNLLTRLMAPDNKLLTQRIDKLVEINNQYWGIDYNGFSILISHDPTTMVGYHIEKGGRITEKLTWEPNCPNTLKKEAVEVVLLWKNMRDDRSYLILVLGELVALCKSEQEVRNALPECLVQLLPSLSYLPRTNEAGYTLDSKSCIKLENAMSKFHTYSAMHFMV